MPPLTPVRPARLAMAAALALSPAALAPRELRAAVVISEIHYHPPSPDGKVLEFVELENTSASEQPLGGWRLEGGGRFEFPEDARLPPRGHAVTCRDPEALAERFALPGAGLYGPFDGSLDNGGEEIVLTDAAGAVRDAVPYDDKAPWSEAADGDGSSLQRLCATGPSHLAENWAAARPSPLAPSALVLCPPPSRPAPRVVISEIHYHPAGDNDAREEYLELHNPGPAPVSLAGWKLAGGVDFDFPPATSIPAGGYLAVTRDQDAVRERLGITNTAGNFSGQLSNDGERVVLEDAAGVLVDVVRYSDRGQWPHGADGMGRSLIRVVLDGPGDDPASWANSTAVAAEGFVHLEAVGTLSDLFTQRVLLSIDGAGECIVDNVVLQALGGSEVNLVENGDFETGLSGWSARGLAAGSEVLPGVGVGASRGLRLVSQGGCDGPCNTPDSVSYRVSRTDLDREALYRLAVDYLYLSGSPRFEVRLLGEGGISVVPQDLLESLLTPGAPNARVEEKPLPWISHRGWYPREPTSRDRVWITARVRVPEGDPPPQVTLSYEVGGLAVELPMADDGAHQEGEAGDGIFGAELPPFPHNSRVYYRFAARDARGRVSTSPLAIDPGTFAPSDAWGLYVNDDQAPGSVLPVYHVLIDGVDAEEPEHINTILDCFRLTDAGFAYRGDLYPHVGVRFRGNTACGIQKRNLKFRFNRGRYFQGLRKINLEGIWTDKALVREHLAWDFLRELGAPYCETEYVRVHLNGRYHGLFLYLEHPDERWLERLGLDPAGCLYKARQPDRNAGQPVGVSQQETLEDYGRHWEEETCEDGDYSDIGEFIDTLHEDARSGPTREFMDERVDAEALIGYQLAQALLNNIDSFAKNHFLLRDTRTERWTLVTWDMDLVFGKFFDPRAIGPGRPQGTLNDCLLSPGGDLNPWFGATVLGNPLLHYLVDFFFRAGGGYYQRAYLVRLWDLLEEKYTSELYDQRLDDLVRFLDAEQAEDLDRWGRYPTNCDVAPDMRSNIEDIKEQIALHRRFLRDYIRAWHPQIPDHARMRITEVMYNPEGPLEDLEYVEIENRSERAVDLSGWSLGGGIEFVFPQGSVVAAGEVFLAVASREAFCARYPEVCARRQVFGSYAEAGGRLSNEGETLRLRDAGPGHPATVDYLRYEDGGDWPEGRDGHSIELGASPPGRDADWGQSWRLAGRRGGTPGSLAGSEETFLRGDATGEGDVNLSDPVFVLNHLFRGGPAPGCLDAADADDDGRILLTDGVYVLSHLFRGGPPPPPPYPDGGPDPTEDGLACGGGPAPGGAG